MMKLINYKKLPHDTEIEKIIIGILIMNKKSIFKIIDIISSKFFYNIKNKIIFQYIKKTFLKYKEIDLFTLINELKINNKIKFLGGQKYIMNIIKKIINYSNIKNYVKILKKQFILRELIKISFKIIKNSYNNNIKNIFNFLYKIEKKIFSLFKNNKNSFIKINKIIKKIKNKLKNHKKYKNKKFGILSGFKKLDKITYGWQKSDLIVIAARPGMGKTSFALSMILNILKDNIPICFFSLEMSSNQLINKLLSYKTKINFYKIKNFNFNKKEIKILKKKINYFNKYNLYIDDTPSLSLLDFKIKSRRYILKYNIKLIIIDYLQLMSINSKKYKFFNREQEISIISKNLKSIAKEFNIPIITISQLSRAVEIRGGDKRPILSDLRESGAIEQDADLVIFIYRSNYYYQYNDNNNYEKTELIISKHRNGMLKTIKINFFKKFAFFKN